MFIKRLLIDWDKIGRYSYLKDIEAISNVEKIEFQKDVTFFVGENGSGKSTLLEAMAIAAGFNPEGGTKNYAFSTYDSHSFLYEAITLSKMNHPKWGYFLRAESFYNVASKELEYMDNKKEIALNLHGMSHGEGFLKIVNVFFKKDGLYFLDEPEAALSPQRQLTLLLEIDRLRKEGCQFFIVTHSPILLGLPDSEILTFDDGKIHPIDY